ncbi:uncharacterized protein PAC_01627 [Phialocephala subalpina]|uniref:Beta-glucuronidase C-terminal domain-containing protein n=1 Tax=Phialocephala subalpina TaxID=576137 RepID=A0A1L7WG51_9HELO|nr:uncharacterized protein PAC_01627 [Phialocephala subalpina]
MFSFLALLSVLGLAYAGTTTLTVPGKPPPGCATLDRAPVALSFEFYEFPSYFTNVSNTETCMKHLHDVSGVWPRIRIGGTSQDYSTYVPSLDPYIVYSVPDPATLAKNITFGPRFIDLAESYPGTVVMGLNRGGDNLNNTIEAAVAIEKRMHNLQAIELGNEPDIYAALNFPLTSNSGYNLTTWTPETEAHSESTWQLAVTSPLAQPNIIQAGNLEQPPSLYNASNLIKYEDPLALETVKTFSHHNYPQSTYFADSVNLEALMKHQNIVENVGTFKTDVEVARSVGWEYVFGETNSVSGGGSPLISPLFGTAIWLLDYVLQAATINIKRTYLHQCTIETCWYAFWDRENVNAPFYGAFVATYVLAGGKYISSLDDGTSNYGGYVVFDEGGKQLKLVLVNSDYYTNGTRGVERFVIEGLKDGWVRGRRLTAESALSKVSEGNLPTFGGRWFESDCSIAGREEVEVVKVEGGKAGFEIAASEALIVDLC